MLKFSNMQEQRSFSNFFKGLNSRSNGSNSIPMTGLSPVSGQTSVPQPPPPPANLNVSNLVMGNNASCVHSQRNNATMHLQQNHIDNDPTLLDEATVQAASHTPYFMNRDGCMETAAGATSESIALATGVLPPAPPPPLTGNPNVINPQGIKGLVHDVQLKRQKEIRDMMKKKREKAVLVDRISRWLFPTSFILLNIVYWALFGDHDLW